MFGVGPQVERGVGGQDDRLEQLVDVRPLLGRDVDEHRVAAVLLGDEAVLGQLLPDLGRVGALEVDLVDGDDDRHLRRLGVVQGLDGLWHHAVVGRHDEDRDVGDLCTAGAHGGERLVARGVDEGDRAVLALVLDVHLVGTDVLGDAAGLALDDVLVADRVEQLGLSVVDVTHDGDDRRTRLGVLVLLGLEVNGERLQQLAVLVLGRDHLDVVAQLLAEQAEGVLVDGLGRSDHLAQVEQHLDQRAGLGVDPLGEVGQRRPPGQPDRLAVAAGDPHAPDRGRLHVVVLLALLALALATAGRLAAGTAERARRAAATAAAATGSAGEAATTGTTATAGTAAEAATARATGATAGTAALADSTSGPAGAAGTTALTRTTAAAGSIGARRHHARVGTRATRPAAATGTWGHATWRRLAGTWSAVAACLRALHTGRAAGRERVVARTGPGGTPAHAGALGAERVVARTRPRGTRSRRAGLGPRGRGRGGRPGGRGRGLGHDGLRRRCDRRGRLGHWHDRSRRRGRHGRQSWLPPSWAQPS